MSTSTAEMVDTKTYASGQRPFRFMDLPKEIRFMIYAYLMKQVICPVTVPDLGVAFEADIMDPACTQVSRQFREEAHIATQFTPRNKSTLYFVQSHQHIRTFVDIISMAHGFDQRLRRKYLTNSKNTTSTRKIPRRIINVASNKLLELLCLYKYQSRLSIDLHKTETVVRHFLEQTILKLRQNSQFEYRILIPGRDYAFKAFIKDSIDVATVIKQLHERFQWSATVVFQDEGTQMATHRKQRPEAQERLQQDLASPEEVAYLMVKRQRWPLGEYQGGKFGLG